MNGTDPSKRIPKSLDTDTDLFGTYTMTDLAVAFLPGVFVMLCMQIVLSPSSRVAGVVIQDLTIPVAGAGVAVGVLFVYLTPAYASSLEWLTAFTTFHTQRLRNADADPTEATGIRRIHADANVIERTDGAYLALVEVSPPTMALATDAEWARKAEAFQDFCNTTLGFPIQIFSTTKPFPVEEYLSRYEARLSDPDVQANPQLRTLIEEYTAWYETDLEARQMTIRDHYVVVPVEPRAVQFESESPFSRLISVPLLGLFIEVWLAPPEAERTERLRKAVDDRAERVVSGIRGIEGCDASRIDANEAAGILAEFWNGASRESITRSLAEREAEYANR